MNRHWVLLIFCLAVTVPARAGEGPYLGLESRATFAVEETLRQAGADAGKLTFYPGFMAGIAFGDTFRFGLRPELELRYGSSAVKRFIDAAGAESPSHARVDTYGALVNVWYEARSRESPLDFLHPYLGGGAGGVRVQFRDPGFASTTPNDDGRTLVAYQGGAGIGFDATDFVTVSVDYRYFETGRGAFRFDPNGARFSTKYRAQSIGASLRFSFAGSEYRHATTARTRETLPPPAAARMPAMDTDADGVPDELDKCPGTPAGFKVDLDGCIVQQNVVLQAVDFEAGSDRLTPASRITLDRIAAALRGQPTLKVEIQGYTDSRGSAADNLRLSHRRATSVLNYLVSNGVSHANLTARGFGQAKPIGDNNTEAGRAQNRRVEFMVLNPPPTLRVIEKRPKPGA